MTTRIVYNLGKKASEYHGRGCGFQSRPAIPQALAALTSSKSGDVRGR
jgi:hypothetical protein